MLLLNVILLSACLVQDRKMEDLLNQRKQVCIKGLLNIALSLYQLMLYVFLASYPDKEHLMA